MTKNEAHICTWPIGPLTLKPRCSILVDLEGISYVSIWLKGSLFPYRAVFWMWCSIEDVWCHLLYVCVNSDSSKDWHWHDNAQHLLRVLLYLGGYSLVTIGKLREVSLEQILVWMYVVSIIWTFGCDINS